MENATKVSAKTELTSEQINMVDDHSDENSNGSNSPPLSNEDNDNDDIIIEAEEVTTQVMPVETVDECCKNCKKIQSDVNEMKDDIGKLLDMLSTMGNEIKEHKDKQIKLSNELKIVKATISSNLDSKLSSYKENMDMLLSIKLDEISQQIDRKSENTGNVKLGKTVRVMNR